MLVYNARRNWSCPHSTQRRMELSAKTVNLVWRKIENIKKRLRERRAKEASSEGRRVLFALQKKFKLSAFDSKKNGNLNKIVEIVWRQKENLRRNVVANNVPKQTRQFFDLQRDSNALWTIFATMICTRLNNAVFSVVKHVYI